MFNCTNVDLSIANLRETGGAVHDVQGSCMPWGQERGISFSHDTAFPTVLLKGLNHEKSVIFYSKFLYRFTYDFNFLWLFASFCEVTT